MILPPAGRMRVLVATMPVDFRKGMDGLDALAQEQLRLDPFSGAVLVFRARRADRVKILLWDGSGLVLIAKRLDEGRFAWPAIKDGVMTLSTAQLAALFEGIVWTPSAGQVEGIASAVTQTTPALSTKDSDGGLDAEAALLGSTELASDGRLEDGEQLEGRSDPGPYGLQDFASLTGPADGLPSHHPLGPTKADLVEIQVGVVRADVVEHPSDGPADAVVEALGRIRMDGATDILAFRVTDRVMGGEGFADREEGFPFVAHQVGRKVDGLAQHPARFTFGQIGDDTSSCVPSRRAGFGMARPLNDRENRRLRCPWLPFAPPPRARAISALSWSAADIELVDFDGAAELLLTGHQ